MAIISFGPEGMIDTRTGLLVDENTYLPEYSAGGDYYRKVSDLTKAENLPYWRGAGASHQYQYFKDTDPGEGKAWTQIDPGEHDEQASYFWAGLNTPQYLEALNKASEERSALEQARLLHPDAVGQASVRNEYSLTGGTNEDDWRQELAFLQAYRPDLAETLSESYTPEMRAAIAQQLANSTPESQSTREGPSFMDDVFTNIIPGMLAVVGGVNAMGGLAGLGEAGAISAADASAAMGSGIDAGGWGALDSLGSAAAAAEPGSIAAQWASLEGSPTLVMGGDVSAGGLGAFASDAGFAGQPLFVDDAIGQGTGLNSPDMPWNEAQRLLNQTLAENPLLEQGVNTLKTVNTLNNAYNNIDGIYDMLTTDPQPQQQQASPLQQVSAPDQFTNWSPFGVRNSRMY